MSYIDKNINKIKAVIEKDISGLGVLKSVEKIDLSLIDDTKNVTRVDGRDQTVINTIVKFINQGNYDETGKYCPPIVIKKDNKYELVSGNHRYDAHMAAGKFYMLVGIVDFFSDVHKHKFQINENDEENDHYVKKSTNSSEIVNIVLCLIKQKILSDEKNEIENFLCDLKQLNHKKGKDKKQTITKITNDVLSKLNSKSVDYVHTYNPTNLKSKVSEVINKNSNLDEKNIVLQGFKSCRDIDYDVRSFKNVINKVIENINQNNFDSVYLLSHVLGGNDPSDVEEIRDFKNKHYLDEQIDFCRKVCYVDDHLKFKGMKNGIKDIVSLKFIPQLGEEISNISLDEWIRSVK